MKRILLQGLLLGLVMLMIGFAFNAIFGLIYPGLAEIYANGEMFRPWEDPLMSLFFLHPFLLGFVFSWIWKKAPTLHDGKSTFCSGMKFAFFVLFISTLPGMLISYSSFQIEFILIIFWTISAFVQALTSGLILAKLEK